MGTAPGHGQLLSLEAEVRLMWWVSTMPGSHHSSDMRWDTCAQELAIEGGVWGVSSVTIALKVLAPRLKEGTSFSRRNVSNSYLPTQKGNVRALGTMLPRPSHGHALGSRWRQFEL